MNGISEASKHSTPVVTRDSSFLERQAFVHDHGCRGVADSIRKLSISSAPRVSQQCRFFSKNQFPRFQSVLLEKYSKNRLFALKPVAYRIPCKDPATIAITDCSSGVSSSQFRVSEQKISSHSSLQHQVLNLRKDNYNIAEVPSKPLQDLNRSDRTIPAQISDFQSPDTFSIRHQQSEGQFNSKGLVLKRTSSIHSLHLYLNSKIETPIQLDMDQFRRLMTDNHDSQGGIRPILKNSKTNSPTKQTIDCTVRTSQKTMDYGKGSETSKSLKKKVSFSKNRIVKLYNPKLSEDNVDWRAYSHKGSK